MMPKSSRGAVFPFAGLEPNPGWSSASTNAALEPLAKPVEDGFDVVAFVHRESARDSKVWMGTRVLCSRSCRSAVITSNESFLVSIVKI